MSVILGIDTSNYTTSAALADESGILRNEKIVLDVPLGGRGLRQSDAVFAHTRNLPLLMERLGTQRIAAVGYSARPRDAEGSYMPCFEAGAALARSMGALLGIPVYAFSHQAGHIRAALYSAGCDHLVGKEFLAFHVSGGTTDLLHVHDNFIETAGGTLDLNAGQAVDRVGVMLGMKFPCGAQLEALAGESRSPQKPKICVNGTHCNLSGLENKATDMQKKGMDPGEIAAYTIEFILRTLEAMTDNARQIYGDLPLVYAGGVMSNRRIREHFQKKYSAFFAEPAFSCDNAAGTALLTRDAFRPAR